MQRKSGGTAPNLPSAELSVSGQAVYVGHAHHKVFYACLHGNSESYLIIRELDRDLEIESEMVTVEQHFWESHVLAQVLPLHRGGRPHHRKRTPPFLLCQSERPAVVFNTSTERRVSRYLELQQQKVLAESGLKAIEQELQRMKGLIIAEMGASCAAACSLEGVPYQVTYNPVRKPMVSKENLVRLQAQHPDIYANMSQCRKAADYM
jgi:predicted phage-related endonuclease